MNDINIILLMCAMISLLIAALSFPMALQKVKPNGWYGFRTPKTLANEQVWYEANRVAGIDMTIAGFLSFFATVVLYLFSGTLTLLQIVVTLVIVMLGSLIAAVIHSFIVLRRL